MIVIPKPKRGRAFCAGAATASRATRVKVAWMAAFSAAVVVAHDWFPQALPAVPVTPFALLGIALSVFLGFRTNACYDRWWEARRQWGELISLSRHLCRQTLLAGEEDRRRILSLSIAFAHALADHLRPQRTSGRARDHLPAEELAAVLQRRNRPDAILLALYGEVNRLRERQVLSDIAVMTIDRTVAGMGLVQAASERLVSSPVPAAYSMLLQRSALLFCMSMPFAFAGPAGWLTPLVTAAVAYAFFGLDALAGELEEPFDDGCNAMPIGAMADIIEISLRDALGEDDLPPAPVPDGYVLM